MREQELADQVDRGDRVLEIVNHECGEPLLLELQPHQIVALLAQQVVLFAQVVVHLAQLEHALHAHHQLGRPHRLGEEVVAADPQGAVERVEVALRGEEHDRRLGTARSGADPLAHRDAVHVGHLDVEQHAIGPLAIEGHECVGAAAREHHEVALTLQRRARHGPADLVVIDDEDLGSGHHVRQDALFVREAHLSYSTLIMDSNTRITSCDCELEISVEAVRPES